VIIIGVITAALQSRDMSARTLAWALGAGVLSILAGQLHILLLGVAAVFCTVNWLRVRIPERARAISEGRSRDAHARGVEPEKARSILSEWTRRFGGN
jgi:hypothetical protein